MTKNYKRFLALLLTLLLVFGAMPGSFSVRADNPAVEDEIISESPPMAENDGVPLSPEELQAIAAARPANAAEMVDTDLDGIPDIWETNGADYNSDGIVDFPLHQMGCEVGVRDVFVEVDWMEGMHDLSYNFNDKGVLVSKTNQQMLEMTAEEFGRHGINLHIDFGPGSIDYVTGIAWDDYPGGAGGNAFPYSTEIIYDGIVSNSAWTALSEENLTYLRSPVFHHSMFVNSASIGGWGGWGNVSGMRTLVIDGRSFMHELGHNLGLSHGGFGDGDNYKPNYLSCMNYGYTSSDFLFSECILPDLDENNLSEPVGIDPGSVSSFLGLAGSSFFYRNALKISFPLVAGKPVDYNGNGNTTDTGIVQDINNDGKLTVLKGSQDWENLRVNCNGVGSLVLLRMYTVSYNTTGGSTAPASQQKLKNQSLHLSSDIPTHDRLTFAGWSTTLGGAVEYAPGALFNIDASTTLYAVWTANENEFTLMLDKNNSSATISSVPIEGTVNGMVKISSTLPACVGSAKKDFVGWALSPSAQVPDYLPGEEISLSEDTTLYGVWSDSTILTGNTAGTCMLDFKYPNQIRWVHLGTGWEENNWTITFQNATSMPTQYAIVKGTSLSGTSWTASALTSSSQNLFSAGTVVPATDYWIKVTANTTNTALISPVAFSVGTSSSKLVSYWANGGTDAPPPALKQDDVPFTISSDVPTREGYIFMGWSTVLGTGTVSYQPGAVYNSNLNLRLFAVWESYTIGMQRLFIDLQGGSPSGFPNVLLTDENGKVTLPAAPTHVDRKNFVGYAESPDAEQYQYLPGETITIRRENTLYALWKDAPQASQSSPVKLDFYYPGQVIWINFGSGYNGNYSAYVRSTYSAILGVTRTLNGSAASWTTDASNPKYLNAGAINASQDVWFRLTSSETNPDLKWETVFSLWENSVAHHTICYFANNGINAPAPQIKMTGTSITLSSETPTRQGYTFKGWGTTAGATVAAYQPGASYSTNSHLALFAIWESNSILSITSADSFNAVGGIGGTFQVTTDSLLPLSYSLSGTVPSGVTINSETGLITILPQTAAGIYNFTVKVSDGVSPDAVQNFTLTVTDYTVKFMNGETEFESKRFAYNTDLSLPTGTPVKVSDNYNTYSFKGWFTSSEGGTQVTAATKVTADAIYYAQFTATPIIYTITFNYNGVYDTKTTTYNGTVTLPAAPTKAADSEWTYEFAGWFTQEEGGTQFTASTPVTANAVYYAQFTKTAVTYTVTFNFGGVYDTKTTTYNSTVTLPAAPTKAADSEWTYEFAGWFTQEEGGTQFTASTPVTANAVYYAQFTKTAVAYTVTFNYNGVYDTKYASYNGTVALPAAPTKAADSEWTYEFTGWFTQEEGGTQFTASTPVTANAVYYAQFIKTAVTYTVTFNFGGVYDTKYASYNGTVALPAAPTKAADSEWTYEFAGWFTQEEGGTQFTASTLVTANAVYYAQFTKTAVAYTVIFNYNGVYDKKYASYNGTVALPAAPTKAADSEWTYEFAGWFTQEEGGTQFTASTPVTANITVFAQWQKTAKPHEHTWNAWYTVTQATCTATGIERHDCTSCDEFQTRETAKLAHIDENKDAHCDICSADMSEDTCGCCSEHNHDLNSFFGRFACWFCKLWQMILRLFGKA